MYGNNGKILKINLSTGEIKEEYYDEEFAGMFLGGNGLAAKLIYDNVSSDVDPFAPENAIVFTTGPLTGTPVWGTSRGHMATISPYTNLFADSNYGGDFGAAQKKTGFDAIYITGKSSKHVYLLITEEGGKIKDGTRFWGKDTEETIAALEAEEGKGSVCASIGPAGENGILFANIICGGKRYGAAGRAGMGTVMGAKNLKAIVAKGNKKTEVADMDGLKNFLKEQFQVLKKNTVGTTSLGTPSLINTLNSRGILCTHNNTRETFEHAQDISGELIKEKYTEKNIACHGCPVACGKKVHVSEGEYAGESVKMPEYETLYAMGAMLDNRDIVSIFNGNHVCDLMGMDTISMGVTLSFVAECMERGIVSETEIGGKVNFADGKDMVNLIKKTVKKEGIGEYLAMGSQRLSGNFGKDSYKYLYSVQGLECAGHSARGLREMSLAYSTSTRGGSHHDGRPNYGVPQQPDPGFDSQPEYVLRSQASCTVADSLVMCRFTVEKGLGEFGGLIGENMVKILNYVTGWNLDVNGIEKIGERIYNLERLINVRRGINRKNDILPYRVMHEPIPDGPSKGRYCAKEDLDKMLDKYYALRGWDHNGIPTNEKLAELGLNNAQSGCW